MLDEAIELAPGALPDARARVEREFVRLATDMSAGTEPARRVADAALALFARGRDGYGEYRAWSLLAQVAWTEGQAGRADTCWVNAAGAARQAGDQRDLFDVLGWRATAAALGPKRVDDAIGTCQEFRELVAASPVATMWMINPLALLHAMKGNFERAEQLLDEADAIRRQLGSPDYSVSHMAAYVRLLAGQPALAEVPLRLGLQKLESMGGSGLRAKTTAMLAQAVYAQGGFEEAGEMCRETADRAAAEDIDAQAIWRSVQAKLLARNGRSDEAIALARGAVALMASTDLLSYHGDAMLDLAEVMGISGRTNDSNVHLRQALELYEAKGNITASARARSLLRDHGAAA